MLLHPSLVDPAQPLGQQRGEDQPDGHGLTMAEVPVGMVGQPRCLERMGQRVAVVEDHPAIPFTLVGGHDLGLDGDAPRHLLLHLRLGPGRLAQEGVLRHLALPAGPLPGWERRQGLGVAEHGAGLPERPHEVLPLGQVHPGLPADGRVDLAQQRRGDVDVRRPPVVRRSGESTPRR